MLHALLALVLLFAVAALLWWWARGGVVPAIMLSAPPAAFLPVLAVSLHDARDATNLVYAPAVMLALLALAWAPRLIRARLLRA